MQISMIVRLTALLLVISFAALSTGCGQKGPLYLPDKDKTPTQQTSPSKDKNDKR